MASIFYTVILLSVLRLIRYLFYMASLYYVINTPSGFSSVFVAFGWFLQKPLLAKQLAVVFPTLTSSASRQITVQ